ncbi:MAG TPA: pyrimidine utilization protein B, partial [Candidatus Binatia bacterium]|nr:pyrimidine utilization protein B [Candidatus Binatia bacterium]
MRLDARPEPLDLDPARTALVVVDMQNAFVSRGGLLDLAGVDIGQAPRVVAAARRSLAAARRLGLA